MRARGFTLLEVLAALAVLGLLLLALRQGSDFGFTAWGTQARLIARDGELDSVDRALRRLIGHMDPGSEAEPGTLAGDAHTLAFTTDLPVAAEGLPTRAADIGLGVDGAKRLVLRWETHLHAQRFVAAPPPHIEELVRNVDHLDLAYWRDGAWTGSASVKEVPQLVRVHIVFASGDARHWPDIIAAPVREAPAE
jgi:general secretion pathway protein J